MLRRPIWRHLAGLLLGAAVALAVMRPVLEAGALMIA